MKISKQIYLILLLSVLAVSMFGQFTFVTNFPDATLPDGWSVISSVNGTPSISVGVTQDAGTNCMNVPELSYVVTPEISLPSASVALQIYISQVSVGNGNFTAWYGSSATGPWTSFGSRTGNAPNYPTWNPYPFTIPAGLTNIYIAFYADRTHQGSALYLDNISLLVQKVHFRSLTSGNWNSPSTWQISPNGRNHWVNSSVVPDGTNDLSVRIKSGDTVTLTAMPTFVSKLTIDAGGTFDKAGYSLTQDIDNNGTTRSSVAQITSGTLTRGIKSTLNYYAGVVIPSATNYQNIILSATSGSYSLAGPITAVLLTVNATNTLDKANIAITGAVTNNGIIKSSVATICSGTLTLNAGSTIDYTAAVAVPTRTYHNLTLSAASAYTVAGAVTVNGAFTTAAGSTLATTGANMLYFASGATGAGSGVVNGYVQQNSTTVPSSGSYANQYLELGVAGGSSAISSFVAVRSDVAQTIATRTSITKTWNLSGTTSANSTYTLSWNSGFDNGNSFASGYGTVWRYNGSAWVTVATVPVTTAGSTRSLSFSYNLGTGGGNFTVLAPNPVITASTTALTDFGLIKVNSNSNAQTYTVSGTELYANLVVTAPTGFKVSNGGAYSGSVNLAPTNGTVSTTTIYVQFWPTALGPTGSLNITNASTGATTKNVSTSGTGMDIPTIISPSSASITQTSAYLGGNVTSINYSTVTTRGIYWSLTNGFPDGSGTIVSQSGSYGVESFSLLTSSLTANTTYYFKAFATNAAGTAYTSQGSFTTLGVPTVTTQAVTAISHDSATGNGTITALGNPSPTQYGVCWSTSLNPTTADSHTSQGAYSGGVPYPFTSAITGLTPNVLYHVRAYATNSQGTVYGSDVTFTASDGPGHFRTINSGNWNDPAIWEWSADGVSNWISALHTPTYNDLTITIRNMHAVTLVTNVTADQLTVNTGGELIINTGITLGVNDGTGTDVTINGALTTLGSGIMPGAGSFALGSGALLTTQHPQGISTTTSTGCAQLSGGISLSNGANYIFNGTQAQHSGNALSIANHLTVNNSFGVIFTNSIEIKVLYQISGDITYNSTDFVDGYESQNYKHLRFPETGYNISNWSISMDTPTLMPYYVNRRWVINGSYSNNKVVTFYWTNADDNNLDWSGKIPKVWKGGISGTGYMQIAYDVSSANRYVTVSIPASLTKGTYVIGQEGSDGTLPVELSSFTVTMNAYNQVTLMWVTQSETNVSGFRIYRNTQNNLETASQLSIFVPATNTSQMQVYQVTDEDIYQDGVYYYWLENVDLNGDSQIHGPVFQNVTLTNVTTPNIPIVHGINTVYPNPFNPLVTISCGMKLNGSASLKVFNTRGQLVKTVFSGVWDKGTHTLQWDGTDETGQKLSSGVYLMRMETNSGISVKKIVLSK